MDDRGVLAKIGELVAKEHRLEQRHSGEILQEAEQLRRLETALDQCRGGGQVQVTLMWKRAVSTLSGMARLRAKESMASGLAPRERAWESMPFGSADPGGSPDLVRPHRWRPFPVQ